MNGFRAAGNCRLNHSVHVKVGSGAIAREFDRLVRSFYMQAGLIILGIDRRCHYSHFGSSSGNSNSDFTTISD